MIYFTRQEQRIVILLGVVMLLGIGVLLIKRFQPGWTMRLSLGEPDFDIAKDEVSPRLTSSDPPQEQEPDVSDADKSIPPPAQALESDQEKISDAPPTVQQSDQSNQGDGTGTFRININTATREQLETLPRIGPVLAQRIIDYRQKNGNFRNISELTNVSGIGDATLQRISDRITVEESNGSR